MSSVLSFGLVGYGHFGPIAICTCAAEIEHFRFHPSHESNHRRATTRKTPNTYLLLTFPAWSAEVSAQAVNFFTIPGPCMDLSGRACPSCCHMAVRGEHPHPGTKPCPRTNALWSARAPRTLFLRNPRKLSLVQRVHFKTHNPNIHSLGKNVHPLPSCRHPLCHHQLSE